jgi:hypothetical protein
MYEITADMLRRYRADDPVGTRGGSHPCSFAIRRNVRYRSDPSRVGEAPRGWPR